jgi:hypothetical protein
MATTPRPSDFKALYRSLTKEQRVKFAEEAGTTTRYIDTHLVDARKIPGPKLMERLYVACVQSGARFSKADLVSFFYEANKDREGKYSVIDRAAATDDTQAPVGSVEHEQEPKHRGGKPRGKTKEARMVI